MNKQKSTLDMVSPISKQTSQGFDELEHRFSDLLVNLSLISEDKSDNSDNLFKEIKSCKNITFTRTRSKSHFEDTELFRSRQEDTPVKHALLTSDEEESFVNVNSSQHSLTKKNVNASNPLRSPLKAYPSNSPATQKILEKSSKKTASRFLSGSAQRSMNSNRARFAISSINISSPDDSLSNKENSIITKPNVVTPDFCKTLNTFPLFNQSPLGVERTPVNSKKGKYTVKKTSTPLNKALIPNIIFKTPVSSDTIAKTQLSAQKKHSIDKAVASARREFEEMARSMKLKKKTMKAKQKDGNDSIFYETCDLSLNSPVRNSLFSTPTLADKTIEVKTPVTGMRSNNNALTGVKKLDMKNKLYPVPGTQSNDVVTSSRKYQIELSDEDDDSLPATQPLSSILLQGVVAYVEVRWGKDYMSEGTKAELESLGALVEKNFTRKVTHCFFHGGKMSTYRKAIEWKVPLVSTLWIEACKAAMDIVPLKGYSPHGLEKYKEDLPLYKLKTNGLRRAVTDSKIRQKPWKEDELNKKSKKTVVNKRLPPAPTFKEANNVIDALHTVANDLRKATKQFEKVLTSPVLQKSKPEENYKNGDSFEATQETNISTCRRKRNKKLIFGSSSDEDNRKAENNPTVIETENSNSRISDTNDSEIRVSYDSEIRVSYDSDDLLVYAKKQAANSRCSAPPRLLTSRKCKKLLSSCKDTEKSKEISSGTNVNKEETKKSDVNTKTTRSKQQPSDGKRNRQELSLEKPTQTKKRRLLLPSQVIANFEQDSGESTPPASPRCPYKVTPNKKPKSGLAVKNKTVRALVNVKVSSDCDSDDSLTRAARRESSALFVKKDKKNIPQKTTPTIVCTSLSRSDEDVVKAIVAQLGTFTVEGMVSERTTHVVTPAPRRTINLLKGIARGCWVLNVQWVYESVEVGQWLPEERFEMTQFSPAVKMARCDRQAFGPEFGLELFTGLGPFYVCRATVPPARDLAELLRLGGGCVVSNARAAKVVIGTTPPLLSPGNRTPPRVVREKWILDCITKMSQLDMADYAVCVEHEP